MMRTLLQRLPPFRAEADSRQAIFAVFALLSVLSIGAAFALQEWVFLALPFALLLVFQTVMDYRKVFYLLMVFIPLNIEVDNLPGDLGLDLPGEPLMAGLMVVYGLLLLSKVEILRAPYWGHGFTVLMLLQWGWMLFVTLYAENPTVSWKFFLAKSWYMATFYFLALHLLHDISVWKRILWLVFFPLVLATTKVLLHHAYLGFSFTGINPACFPFFRNHVSYAAILALSLPLFWHLRLDYRPWSWQRHILGLGMLILFAGMVFSYTRAAYLALFLSVAGYLVMRWKLIVPALVAAFVVVGAASYKLVDKNYFLKYAPTERTIAHQEFGDLVKATYTFEDASTMERYYRWIGGIYMINDRPWTGFGPNNFYPYYRRYTLNRFETYLSDNYERSGIHNYFLMLAVEQGLPGMALFIVLLLMLFVNAQRYYHAWPTGSVERRYISGAFMCLVVIAAFLLMNDLIETDKVGPFFFLCMVVLLRLRKTSSPNSSPPLTENSHVS